MGKFLSIVLASFFCLSVLGCKEEESAEVKRQYYLDENNVLNVSVYNLNKNNDPLILLERAESFLSKVYGVSITCSGYRIETSWGFCFISPRIKEYNIGEKDYSFQINLKLSAVDHCGSQIDPRDIKYRSCRNYAEAIISDIKEYQINNKKSWSKIQ